LSNNLAVDFGSGQSMFFLSQILHKLILNSSELTSSGNFSPNASSNPLIRGIRPKGGLKLTSLNGFGCFLSLN